MKSSDNCQNCSPSGLCISNSPMGVNRQRVGQILQRARSYPKAHYLARQGDSFESLYTVKSGAFKAVAIDNKGHEKERGLYLPGDVIGLDAITQERYSYDLIALEASSVCALPYADLLLLSYQSPPLQKTFLRFLSKTIGSTSQMDVSQGMEERLLEFGSRLASYYHRRGFDSTLFPFPLPKKELANLLGRSAETLSRGLKTLEDQGVLCFKRQSIPSE